LVTFTKIVSNNPVLDRIQDRIVAAVNPLALSPYLSGHLLTAVTLAVGDNSISHGLARALLGWTIVRQRAAATIFDKQDGNPMPGLFLSLNSSAPVTVDIYVF
jgi:hypothetical protein